MTSLPLKLAARLWLAHRKGCMIVTHELSPRSMYCGEPDAYGVTRARFAIEVEAKRSAADFRADKFKRSRRYRDQFPEKYPKEFYYLVPEQILESVRGIVPPWAGLLSFKDIHIVMNPPFSKNQDIKHIAHAIALLAAGGVLVSVLSGNTDRHKLKQVLKGHDWNLRELPRGPFKSSGTDVATSALTLRLH